MFVSSQQEAPLVVAMQAIEVISMDDGEDNVRPTTSLSSPPSIIASSPSLDSSSAAAASPNHLSSQDEADEATDKLFAMISNETTLPTIDHHARSKMKATPISISGISVSTSSGCGGMASPSLDENDPVNNRDRTKMCVWYYEMSDFLNIDRATASRSITLLDRFMATPVHRRIAGASSRAASSSATDPDNVAGVVLTASQNRDEYQLVALTALILAIKLYERLNIQPEHVSYLSRGRCTSDEVIKMEMIMLAALEWRVCTADKADYVDVFLDVMFPTKKYKMLGLDGKYISDGDCVDDDHLLLSGLKDLANLQIQLSDFESSFSTLKPSMVAFAAVINAVEMKKDEILSKVDQHMFLESVQSLMHRMYNDPLNTNKEREQLARTVERLRVLVDPSAAVDVTASDNNWCIHPSVDHDLTPTSHQRYQQQPSYNNANTIDNESSSTNTEKYTEVSPLDVALESMENFDMSQLLCCGSGDRHASDHTFHADADDGKDDHMNDMETEDDDHLNNVVSNNGLLDESASSFSSIDGNNNNNINGNSSKKLHNMTKSHSPTSIANILFGAAAATMKNKLYISKITIAIEELKLFRK